MKNFLLLNIIFFLTIQPKNGLCQFVEKDWEQLYSNQDSITNISTDITANNDIFVSGYAVSGTEGRNALSLKYDNQGNLLWAQEFHAGNDEIAVENVCDPSGNLYVLVRHAGGSGAQSYLLKYNSSGSLLWDIIIPLGNSSIPYDLIRGSNGNLFVLTRNLVIGQYDAVLTEVNPSGSIVNQFSFDSGNNDTPVNIDEHSGNIIMASSGFDGLNTTSEIILVDNSLTQQWSYTLNNSNWEDVKSIKFDSNGGVVILSNRNLSLNQAILSHLSPIGNLDWSTELDYGNSYTIKNSLHINPSDQIFTAYTHNGNQQLEVQSFDVSGNKLWSKKMYGSSTLTYSNAYVTSNNNQVVVGSTEISQLGSNFLTYSLDLNGCQGWKYLENSNSGNRLSDINTTSNGDIIITGGKETGPNLFEISVINLSQKDVFNAPDQSGNDDGILAYFEYLNQSKDINGNDIPRLKYYGFLNKSGTFLFDYKIAHTWINTDGDTSTTDSIVRWDFDFINNFNPSDPVGNDPATLHASYYLGDIERENISGFKRIAYSEIYPNIDLEIGQNEFGNTIYFVIHPGANYQDIQWIINGSNPNIGSNGSLSCVSPIHTQTYLAPIIYTVNNGGQVTIHPYDNTQFGYQLGGGQTASFNLPTRLTNLPETMIIQMTQAGNSVVRAPEDNFEWSTYIREPAVTSYPAKLVEVISDNNNNTYYTGTLNSAGNLAFPMTAGGIFPLPQGQEDITILKLNSDIEIEWATYFGGSFNEQATSIAINELIDHIYITGKGGGSDFPLFGPPGSYMQNNISVPSIVLELDLNGNALWSSQYPADQINDCEIIGNSLFIVGQNGNLLIDNGLDYYSEFGQGHLAIIKAGGFITHATNFGYQQASGPADNTEIMGITGYNSTHYAITGGTRSTDFPVTQVPPIPGFNSFAQGPKSQAFVAKFEVESSVIDYCYFIPTVPLNPSPGTPLGSDYYYFSKGDRGNDIAFAPDGLSVYVVGETFSNQFFLDAPDNPSGYFQNTRPPADNGSGTLRPAGFIYRADNNGAPLWSTFYMGETAEYYLRLQQIDFDNTGNFFVSGHQIAGDIFQAPSNPVFNIPFANSQPIDFYAAQEMSWTQFKFGSAPQLLWPESFVLGFNGDEELIWSTYLGGWKSDQVRGITTTNDERLYFCGVATTIDGDNDLDPDFFPALEFERRIFDFPRWEYDASLGSNDWYNDLGAGDECEVAGFFNIADVNVSGGTVLIDEINSQFFEVYPNPNNGDLLFLKLPSGVNPFINVYSADGRFINSFNLNGQNYVNIGGISSGTYLITCTTDEGNLVSKFIIE